MGKQTRRKRQRGKNSSPSSPPIQTNNNKSSTLLQRIRHADARTRHAALTALLSYLYDASCQQNYNEKQRHLWSTDIMQAVRERVRDDDLECAELAAQCLELHVRVSVGNSTEVSSQRRSLMAGWTVVLLSRLQDCRNALNNATAIAKNAKNLKQWWALTAQCLKTLCSLVENNPEALERLMDPNEHCIGELLELLLLGRNHLDDAASKLEIEAAAEAKHDNENDHHHESLEEYVQDVTVYAARTLHSALDDNRDLLDPWLDRYSPATSTTVATSEGWEWLLQTSCWHVHLPMAARLHAAGCLVTARQLLAQHTEQQGAWATVLHRHVVETALPLLHQTVEFHRDIASALLGRYIAAKASWDEERADDELEREVIQAVNDRKEPARLIARRQKASKEQKQKEEKVDNAMEEDAQEEQKLPAGRSDSREDMEGARQAWNTALNSLQLALEISANLTSIEPTTPGDTMDEDDVVVPMNEDSEEWGPDQEAQLVTLEESGDNDASADLSPLDTALLEALVENGLPDRVVSCLKAVCTPLVPPPENLKIPPDALEDLSELQAKCAACLGNCLDCLASWQAADSSSVWNELRFAKEQVEDGIAAEAICNAMMLGLRSRPKLRKQIQAEDLEFLLTWLSTSSSKIIQRDLVCMSGVLCSQETHSAQVNENVCRSLIQVLTSSSSAMVTSETLNALMDMYGGDQYTTVFDSCDVLGQFQCTIPLFKKQIQAERSHSAEDDVEQWQETALNASRFVSYKKGQR